jgi:tight adherence protein B
VNDLGFAAASLCVGCALCGRAVADVVGAGAVSGVGVMSETIASRDRRAIGRAWMVRLAPILAAALGWVSASVPGAVVGLVAGAFAPHMWERRRERTRAAQLEDQLAEAVSSLAAWLRAGLSLTRAIAFSAGEADEPLGTSLATVSDRADLGMPLERALSAWAAESGSADVRLLAGVLDLHRRTGGELPTVLDGVAATLRGRRAAAREVRALTAQARLSGAILGFLPIGFFLFLSVTSRNDINAAFHSSVGIAAVAVGLTMQGCAFLWIRSLLRVQA